jgi:hypothetical protein
VRFLVVVVAVGDPEIVGIGDDLSTWRTLLIRDPRQMARWVVDESEKG